MTAPELHPSAGAAPRRRRPDTSAGPGIRLPGSGRLTPAILGAGLLGGIATTSGIALTDAVRRCLRKGRQPPPWQGETAAEEPRALSA